MRARHFNIDWLIAPFLALTALLLAKVTPQQQIDDAYITYRYAYNLLEHGQLVWNQGQFLEGQTNLLWSLLLAAVAFLTNSEIPAVSQTLCLLLGATNAILLFHMARAFGLPRPASLLLSLAFMLTPAAIGFSLAGLESALVAMLTAGAIIATLRQMPHLTALLAGLLFMARPDAAVIAIALVGIDFAGTRSLSGVLHRWWPALLLALGTEAFRALYYHALVPNSIIAKSLPLSLILGDCWKYHTKPYLLEFLAWPTAWLFIASAILGVLAAWRASFATNQRLGWLGVVVLLATLLMVVRNGGDWMEHFRLISQYYPAYAAGLCVFLASARLPRPTLRLATGMAICGISVFLSVSAAWPQWSVRNAKLAQNEVSIDPFYRSLPGRLAGLDLNGLTLSSEAAGMPLFILPQIKGHDPLGLLDPWLSRHGNPAITYGRIDLNYSFFEVQPDIALFHWSGHLLGVTNKQALLQRYEIRCFSGCDSLELAKLVLLKRSLPEAVRQRFTDLPLWQMADEYVARP
ncbi:hypothetical protein JVX91_09880 [Pseudomonas sp. PDNC002]|uniref:hypothetical protein n=1 Tax=Pseudomonas sp. PDNC002 TaxID=2811422 RepID=UPI0019631A96|nr:hypothetical protein [Pseudomonas sp. PDNC002]QRY81386.1 hypothetical protein JVX91_09880 [Pseudomonas sp. PDNC002]